MRARKGEKTELLEPLEVGQLMAHYNLYPKNVNTEVIIWSVQH